MTRSKRLGYPLSYPSFARQIRVAGLRPHCEACSGREGTRHHRDRPSAGRRDPVGLVRAPQRPWGATAYVLLGTLPHSGKVRGVLAEKMDQAHLIEAMDEVMRRLGGTAGCGAPTGWPR